MNIFLIIGSSYTGVFLNSHKFEPITLRSFRMDTIFYWK